MRLGVRNLAQGELISTAAISWRHNVNQSYPSGIVEFGMTIWQGNKESSWAAPGISFGVCGSRKFSIMSFSPEGNAREHTAIRDLN